MKLFVAIVMLLFMPACAMFFLGAYSRKEKTKTGFLYLISVIATAVVTLVLAKGILPEWTIYEVSACAGIAAIVLTFAVALFNKKIKFSVDTVLRTICFISIITAVYSILTYGQARINSDTATATLLVQSQIKHGTYFPKSWNYVNGSIWTIGLAPVVAPFSLLLSNQSLARMLGSALYVLLTVSGIMYMSKRLFRSDMWTLAIPLFLVFLTGENEHILYQGSNTGNMLWLAVNVTLVFLAVNRSRKFFIPYCIIMIAISTAGIRVYAEQIIPMLSALLLAEFGFNHSSDVVERKRIKRLAENAFFVVFPALIGLLFYKGLCSSHSVNNYAAEFSGNGTVFVNSITECSKNLSLYVTNLFHCFGYNGGVELLSLLGIKNLISIATCCLICFVVPFFQWRSIKNEEQEVKFLFGYALVHNAIILVLVVFFGLTTPRYLLSSLFVNVLVSARYMYAHWLKEKTISRVFWPCAFSLAAIIECIVIISASKGWKGVVDANKSFNRYIAERGLDKGYATYWHAYSNSIYSDLGIEYGAFQIRNARLYEYEWLVDSDTFIPEEKTTFLLLEPFELQLIGEGLESQFGKAEEVFQLNGLQIYVFDHDIAANLRKVGVYEPDSLLKNDNVECEDSVFTVNNSGCVFGPVDTIGAGKYRVTFMGNNLGNARCDVFSGTRNDRLSFYESERSDEAVTLVLEVSDRIDDIEYRLFNDGFDRMYLNRIIVTKER